MRLGHMETRGAAGYGGDGRSPALALTLVPLSQPLAGPTTLTNPAGTITGTAPALPARGHQGSRNPWLMAAARLDVLHRHSSSGTAPLPADQQYEQITHL